MRRTILDEAVEALRRRGIKVEVSENHTVLSIPNDLLGFDTGAYEIHSAYQARALEIGKVINEVISRDDRVEFLDTILSRATRIIARCRDSWAKATGAFHLRAISLWQFWGRLGARGAVVAPEQQGRKAAVLGQRVWRTRPAVADQVTEEDFKRNRRIDIRFTIRRPDSAQYEQVKERLGRLP